jgi:hypothetical protein
MPVFAPALWLAAPAGASSSTLPDAPPCIWVVPFAPPRICVSDEAPCASTGPASRAEIATAIAEVFTSFIQFSKVLLTTNSSISSRHRSQPEHAHRRISRYPRTARPPCKPRDVVIVQGFRGHFANPWPYADRIYGASAASGKFRKNTLNTRI